MVDQGAELSARRAKPPAPPLLLPVLLPLRLRLLRLLP
jgi:hypothetical protein